MELDRRPLGRTGLQVTPLCIGGGPISNEPANFGYSVSSERALATVRSVFQSPITFLDTAAIYGHGSVERIIGIALGELGGLPEGWLVGTKEGGVLAKGPAVLPKYAYRPADEDLLKRIGDMEVCCDRVGVPLKAAALQFSTRDPRVASTIVGVSRPEGLEETIELFQMEIPDDLWDELEALVPPEQTWLR